MFQIVHFTCSNNPDLNDQTNPLTQNALPTLILALTFLFSPRYANRVRTIFSPCYLASNCTILATPDERSAKMLFGEISRDPLCFPIYRFHSFPGLFVVAATRTASPLQIERELTSWSSLCKGPDGRIPCSGWDRPSSAAPWSCSRHTDTA